MSDEFDKEAEREKLREKYEREEETRQATEHMSQLLLQGATMTNRHCDDCGDPIFRHDGQEFCPTCEKPVTPADEQGTGAQQASPQTQTDADGDVADQPADPDDPGVEQPAAEQSTGMPADSAAPAHQTAPHQPDQDTQSAPTQAQAQRTQASGQQSQTQSQSTAPSVSHSGDLGDARLALVRRITGLAREAEATEDIQRTRQLFEAVQDGADALAALNRNAER